MRTEGRAKTAFQGPWDGKGARAASGRGEDPAGLTEARVLGEVPEELLTVLFHVPAPTTAAPGGHHDAGGAGVHVIGRYVKPWAGRQGGEERGGKACSLGPQPQTYSKEAWDPPSPLPAPQTHTHPNSQSEL